MSGTVTMFSPAAFSNADMAFNDVVGAVDPDVFLEGLADLRGALVQLDTREEDSTIQAFLQALRISPETYRRLNPDQQEACRTIIANAISTHHSLFARSHAGVTLGTRRFAASAAGAVAHLVPKSPEDPSVPMSVFLKEELGLPEGPFTTVIVRRLFYSITPPTMPRGREEKRALLKSLTEAMINWWDIRDPDTTYSKKVDLTQEPNAKALDWFVGQIKEYLPTILSLDISSEERVHLVDSVVVPHTFVPLEDVADLIVTLRGIGMSDRDIYGVIIQVDDVFDFSTHWERPFLVFFSIGMTVPNLQGSGYNNEQIARAIKKVAQTFSDDIGTEMGRVYVTLRVIGEWLRDREPDASKRAVLLFQMINRGILGSRSYDAVVEVLRESGKKYTRPQMRIFISALRESYVNYMHMGEDADAKAERDADDAFRPPIDGN